YDPLTSAFTQTPPELEAVICQGDDVVVRWSSTATHDGHGLGVPPSGKRVTMRGITWLRVRGGKLIEGWQSSNVAEVVRGLSTLEGWADGETTEQVRHAGRDRATAGLVRRIRRAHRKPASAVALAMPVLPMPYAERARAIPDLSCLLLGG